MRKIKFKAWDHNIKKFITDYIRISPAHYEGEKYPNKIGGGVNHNIIYVPMFEGGDINDAGAWQGDCELLLSTGLHDKNGKEIYEGDILRTTMVFAWNSLLDGDIVETEVITTVVEYQPPGFAQRRVDGGQLYTFDMEDFEVIGNIYENPEGVESDTIY